MIRPRYSQADAPARVSRDFVREVAREVLRMQREVNPPGTDPRGRGVQLGKAPAMTVFKAVVTTAITAATSSSYGSGYVQLYYSSSPDATGGSPDPDWTSTSTPVRNWYQNSGTIAVGTNCYVVTADYGLWLLGADC
jgi:hypothetical protein